MWELDYKESWVLKNWCLRTVMLEKTLESPLDCKEIQPIYPNGNQSWIFIGRTDAETEAPILCSPDSKSQLIGKYPDAEKDRRQEEKGMTEKVTVGWHHGFNGCDFEPIPGDGEGQRNLAYCSPWGHKELDLTEWLNNNSWKLCNIIYFLSMAFISNTFHNQGQMDNYWIIKDVSSLIWTRFLQSVNTSKRHIRIRTSWMAFSPTAI